MERTNVPQEFIDRCTARRLFERTGVMLYDKVLEKSPKKFQSKLREIRNQEKNHMDMLGEVIRSYGANPDEMTPNAKITETACKGIVEVVNQEDFYSLMDAILSAELIDNANWDLLITLCNELGDEETTDKFQAAFNDEEEHLRFISDLVEEACVDELNREMKRAA